MTLIDWLLVGLMWCFSLTALACAVALCLSYRRPPEPAPLIPDFVPEDWGPEPPNVGRPRYSDDGGRTWHYAPRFDPEIRKRIEDSGRWSSEDQT